MVNLTWLSHFLMSIVTFFCFYRLKKSLGNREIQSTRYFMDFFLNMTFFYFLIGLPLFLGNLSSFTMGAFYIAGHIFLYIALSFYIRLPLSIIKPEWEKKGFYTGLGIGAAITLTNIVFWNYPTIKETAWGTITLLHVKPPVGPMIGLFAGLSLLVGGSIFFGWMSYKSDGIDRVKHALLSFAFLLLTVAGPLHDNTTSLNMLLFADGAFSLGIVLLMVGIYLKKFLKVE